MDISMKKEDGSIAVYYDLPDAVAYAIAHALLFATPALVIPSQAVERAEKAADAFLKEAFAPETGACMCSSFSQDIVTNNCVNCGHECHNTRVHCGALR